MSNPATDDAVFCAICDEEIEVEEPAVKAMSGEIRDYGYGPLFSVLGSESLFHVGCLRNRIPESVPENPDGFPSGMNDWIDSHSPVQSRVATAASGFESPLELAVAVRTGSVLSDPSVGERTAIRLAKLLLEDDILLDPPAYLPDSAFQNEPGS